eukprot:symbB.v1.2.033230.t4/scaffold4101.1/size44675/2
MCSSVLLGSVVDITPALQGYFAAPRLKSGRRMGIVVVHDVGDCFYDEVEPPGWPEDAESDEFDEWLANISKENFQEKCLLKVNNCIARLKEEGCIRFGVTGFGWGGMVDHPCPPAICLQFDPV